MTVQVHRVGLAAVVLDRHPHGVHVVGDVCFGDVHPLLGKRLCELGRLARTPLLTATVSGPGARARVRDISAWPDLADPEVADAVAAALRGSVVEVAG